MKKYLIRVKRLEKFIDEEYAYAQNDNYAGSLSTGYPCFGSFHHALTFNSVKTAKTWFEENKTYLLDRKRFVLGTYEIVQLDYKSIKKLC